MDVFKDLKLAAQDFKILYVEDNQTLRQNAAKLLENFFDSVDVAADGDVGLEMFKKNLYPIVITDIKMPHMNGLKLIKYIKQIQPETKILIMSGHDEKEYLIKAIELDVFRYLKKPVNLKELTTDLSLALQEIKDEQNTKILYANLQNIFNYQSSMVIMLNQTKPVLVNQIFLDFYNIDSLEEFRETHGTISKQFMEHDGFLYDTGEVNSINKLRMNERKLFHIKFRVIDRDLV